MDNAEAKVLDLIFGSWRSQILYAGVQLVVFETLGRGPASAGQIAHIPADLVVRRFSRAPIASRSQDLQVEHPVWRG